MCNGNEKCDKCFESNCGLCDRRLYARLHHIHDDLEDLTKLTKHSHKLWVESEKLRLTQLGADKALDAVQLKATAAQVATNANFKAALIEETASALTRHRADKKIKNLADNAAFVGKQLGAKADLNIKQVAELAKFKESLVPCEKIHANHPEVRHHCNKCGHHEKCKRCNSCRKCTCKCRVVPVIIRPEIEIVRPEIVKSCEGGRCAFEKLKAMLYGRDDA